MAIMLGHLRSISDPLTKKAVTAKKKYQLVPTGTRH